LLFFRIAGILVKSNFRMKFIDTHSHIYLNAFKSDLPETIRRAIDSGITEIFLPNIDSGSIDNMNSLAAEYPEICFPIMGLHPTSVKEDFENELRIINKKLELGEYYGIGETGIDLYWDKRFIKQQIVSFRHHLDLSQKYDLPVLIHCRDSFDEVISIVEEYKGKCRGVFHAFAGNVQQAKIIVQTGFYLGIGGIVTYKNSGLAEVVMEIGLDRIVLETDSPFLPPVPKRGMRNEPSFLQYIAKKVAEISGTKIETVSMTTTKNAEELFSGK
jgi:TatD DNase family protein